ncbi:uncharacterized protein [Physcomitrium patens]|uniref:SBP-type domain-containing protein n=1 Tax=Physcomitrium patens TaxID=3218 RepID=A0A2K1JS04_PHYPA|nr:squamosa promoter-binding-like protein 14 [Physcomitrium patens]XP_024390962.1 squamosa promoter-binding-like protein 14 [Physcomitrium patens]XP_024390963.1 squamosa promoter-binding-like protein 14 [Physcomitrium patens]XP_024390964.1 squamosa promoter-binding-like protein 14 [Physcomitrium patens]XP_024390965.1 squamosa promoter-binding-like protein 14 [Physcomitrium patens]XP_024390966.1 squamosa promoter-binding-like protein 14 [Physcomitrium patens]XP_024390967.1 squamosa promoter-bi|eukprot:XP_024390961.1 squamosa promoter-binding-like protein 14 [Physcomitrella patens]
MNPSASSNEQQGDPSWATENWDNPGAVGSLDQASRQYTGSNRQEWEWDPMILAQHPGSGGSNDGSDGDRKNQISAGAMSSLRASYNMLSAGLPSNFTHNPLGIFSSAGIRNFGSLDGSGQISTSANLHSVLGSSGIPGLAATSGTGFCNDIRSYERRCDFFAANMHDHRVKREEVSDGHARIGLNLGVRTYFSTEDTAVGRLGKRHRAGSPGFQVPVCQAEGCKDDLSNAKHYHRRHKVCELHSKAPTVTVGGHTQRFCQQCSRFHHLGEFDEGKRSCRKRLADHNRRRRKPQLNASTSGGTSVESIGIIKACDDGHLHAGINRPNDPKSMLNMHSQKNCGSPNSVSLEDSDEKPSLGAKNLKLRTSGPGYCRSPGNDQQSSHSGMQMDSQSMASSEAQTLLSAISLSPPAPLVQHKSKRQLTMLGGTGDYDHENSVYQLYLQGVSSSQTGPNLSLSSLESQLGHQGGGRGQPTSVQSYNGMESAVQWLRPINAQSDSMTKAVNRSGAMNMQHLISTDSKSGITSASANSSNSQEHDVQAFSPSNQSLLPLESRDLSSPEWMMGSITGAQTSRDGSHQYRPSTPMNNLSASEQLEAGDRMLALINTSNQAGSNPGNDGSNQNVLTGRSQMEFLQQQNTGADSGGDNNSRGGGSTVNSPDLKYPELQSLRPSSYGTSSIYDSHHNLL